MMVYILIVYTTMGPMKIGTTQNSEICNLWENYTKHTRCITQVDL